MLPEKLQDYLRVLDPDNELVTNCRQINEAVTEINSWVEEYDAYPGIKANGYRTYVAIINKFAQLVIRSIRDKSYLRDYKKLLLVSRLHLKVSRYLMIVRKDTVNESEDLVKLKRGPIKSMFSSSLESSTTIYAEVLTLREELYALHELGAFWFAPCERTVLELCKLGIALFHSKSLMVLVSSRRRAELFTECIQQATVHHPFTVWDIVTWRVYRWVAIDLRHLFTACNARTLLVPGTNGWRLTSRGVTYDKARAAAGQNIVHCRLLTHSKIKRLPDKTLVIYCHGGGLVASCPEAHENYLREWVAKLKGVPILSTSYTLRANFPVPLQDVLDVYLWAISGAPQVVQTLGFHPKKVVLSGDSSGGLLVSSLLGPLNDINKLQEILMPSALVLFYPAVTVTALTAPSRCLIPYEINLSLGVYLIIASLYSGADANISPAHVRNHVTHYIPSIILNSYRLAKSLSNDCWFACDRKQFKQQLEKVEDMLSQKYSSLYNYNRFEDFKGISMYLIAAQFDCMVDDAVHLAKLWKGPISLDVMDGLPHGFLQMNDVSSISNSAAKLCLKRLKSAIKA